MKKYLTILLITYITSGCSNFNNLSNKTKVINNIEKSGTELSVMHFNKGMSLTFDKSDKLSLQLAATEFATSVFFNPDFKKAHLNLALTYFYLGEFDLSIKRFEHIKKKFDGNYREEALFNLGVIYNKEKKYDKSIKSFKAKKIINNEVLIALGSIYIQKGDLDLAFTYFDSILKKDPKNPEAKFKLGLLNMKKGVDSYNSAIKYFNEYVEIIKDNPKAYFNLGILYYSKGSFSKASVQFKDALKLKPDFYECKYNLGMTLVRLQKTEEAKDYFLQASLKNNINSMIALSTIYFNEENYDKTLTEIKGVLEIDPNNDMAHVILGDVFFKTGKLKKAEKSYKKAISLSKQNISARNNLALVLREKGDFGETVKLYKKLILDNPNFKTAYKNLGIVYDVYLNNLQKAEFYYIEYLKYSDNKEADIVNIWLEEVKKRGLRKRL